MTGYVVAVPILDKTTESVALAFIHFVFWMSTMILSDIGKEFYSLVFKKGYQNYGLQTHIQFTVLHPCEHQN